MRNIGHQRWRGRGNFPIEAVFVQSGWSYNGYFRISTTQDIRFYCAVPQFSDLGFFSGEKGRIVWWSLPEFVAEIYCLEIAHCHQAKMFTKCL